MLCKVLSLMPGRNTSVIYFLICYSDKNKAYVINHSTALNNQPLRFQLYNITSGVKLEDSDVVYFHVMAVHYWISA